MFNSENYKSNLDFEDKYGIKNINVDKGITFRGSMNLVWKKESNEIINPQIPLAAATIGLNNTSALLPSKPDHYTAWTDIDNQESVMNKKPTCYLILGKPGSGAYPLGEALSKKLKCVHICPKNVIIDEIEQKSPTGLCLDYNMKHNNVIQFNIILSIIKNKIKSSTVEHRGYVISGLPLVTSDSNSLYFFKTINSEESVLVVEELLNVILYNLKKKAKKLKGIMSTPQSSITSNIKIEEEEETDQEPEDNAEEEEEPSVELPKFTLDPSSEIIFKHKSYFDTKKGTLVKQFKEIISLDLPADIIIYLSCPDVDLIAKKFLNFMNYENNQNTVEPFIKNIITELRWPVKYTRDDYKEPYGVQTFNQKYICRQPINYKKQSTEQMCNYRLNLLPLIKEKLKDFDPKYVIKLDARISIHEMVYQISERLSHLPINPVLIPEPLLLEEPPEDIEEFWKSVQEMNLIESGVLKFSRYASSWYNRCPVELKHRQSVHGNTKYAVTLFKHVYLLSSLSNMISFCKNPRPFLKLKYLEPTCRIIIVGTKSSGKTLLSECLSWIFDAAVINYNTFLQSEKQKKYEIFAKSILSEIIASIEDARFEIWQSTEMERYSNLEMWCSSTLTMLEGYIPLLIEYLEYQKKVKILDEQNTESMSDNNPDLEEYEPGVEILNRFFDYKNQLSFLPFLDNLDKCEQALSDRKLIAVFAPIELKTMAEKPGIPSLHDEDVIIAVSTYIVANDLQEEIEPTTEEIMYEMVRVISDMDLKSREMSNFHYAKYIIDGFPSIPEYWEYLGDSKLLPDYTVALIENRELDSELIEYYLGIETITKNYKQRFLLASDPLIKIKLASLEISKLETIEMETIVNDVINNTLNYLYEHKPSEIDEGQFLSSFTESVEKLRQDWDTVKLKLEDNHKCIVEVELENKTDIQMIDEVLLGIRQSYCTPCEPNEDELLEDDIEEDIDERVKDLLVYNNQEFLGETNIYCPISYHNHGVLCEGKSDFCIKYNNKVNYFYKEEYLASFQKDPTKYQSYNKPYKYLPPLRICIVGSIGSGKTRLSKHIAKELGLLHIDLVDLINNYLIPKHFKKVGRRYENSFTDSPLDDEAVVEFQMDEDNENLLSDILSNEIELRRTVYKYFEHGTPMISILMRKIINKIWFEQPFFTTGIVLDGYPRIPSDVEDMITCMCIPDLVIELENTVDNSLERISPLMFNTWKTQLNEAKNTAKINLVIKKQEWMKFITKNIVVKLISDEIIDNIFALTGEPVSGLSTDSVIIDANPSGSSNVDANLFNTYNLIIQEFPEPYDQNEWEKPDEVRERIEARIESIYETENENIQSLKDLLFENKIKVVTLNASKPINKVMRLALLKLTKLRNRNQSFFEQTYISDFDIAELLLRNGFYFLSKFNRLCPVFIFENPNMTFNPYKIYRRKGKVFPVIHRANIYFIVGEDNVNKFRFDPLKYVDSAAVMSYFEYPLRISIIGAPKSGKSNLAEKLARRYGLLCMSRGMALRKTLESMSWSELSSKMLKNLHEGDSIDPYLVIKSVKTAVMDHHVNTHGYVFDGFPDSSLEAMELNKEGLYPNIIFDMSNAKDRVFDRSQKEVYYDIIKANPPYCKPFIQYRYMKWAEKSEGVRNWINEDYQNIYILNGDSSRWQSLQDAENIIKDIINKVHCYFMKGKFAIASADGLCISNEIFQQRMSQYKNMCPLCLRSNILRHSGYPVDRKGIVQFENKFYWICDDHINTVLNNPHCIMTKEKVNIPEIPAVVTKVDMKLIYENGVCIVTYSENLPAQIIETGSNKYAATFKGKTYLFCTMKCLQKFIEKPHMYFDIVVFKERKLFPHINLEKLPNLGNLEQTLAKILTDACCSVNASRPKYPGISFPLSARRVPVPDDRFDYLCEYHKPASKVPAFLNVVDIAGLVRGAAEGQGLGNAFLSHIKACDAIFNLCRAFDDEDVIHVDGDVNPIRDLETIGEELRLKDEEQLLQNIDKLDRVVNRGSDKKLKPEYETLMKIKTILIDEKKHIRFGDWSVADIEVLNRYLFLTSKPALYLVNLSEKDYIRKKNKWLPKLKEWIDKNDPGAPLIPFSGALEMKLFDMDMTEKAAFLKENNITSALDKIIVQGYKALQLEYFFTAGQDEVKAWTIQKGTKAPQAAGRIHTDFEKGFIMAEVMHYKDFKEEGTEAACKSAGKYRQQGRNYVVEDGDIIFFKFNAGAGLKDAKKK